MSPELRALKDAIEAALAARLPAHSAIAQPLIDAMRYASLGGGKRLRPMIVCATCLDLGGTLDRVSVPVTRTTPPVSGLSQSTSNAGDMASISTLTPFS
jgi:geranylgeranyl pyrophosphate synthase